MTLIAAKQISRLIGGYIQVPNITTVGTSINITSSLTIALTTAGYNGGAVSLLKSLNETQNGVVETPPNNVVFLFNAITKEKIYDTLGRQVYGRITNIPGVHIVTFYSFLTGILGIDPSYTFPISLSLNYEVPYRFLLKDVPTDAIIDSRVNFMPDDSGVGSGRMMCVGDHNCMRYQSYVAQIKILDRLEKIDGLLRCTKTYQMKGMIRRCVGCQAKVDDMVVVKDGEGGFVCSHIEDDSNCKHNKYYGV